MARLYEAMLREHVNNIVSDSNNSFEDFPSVDVLVAEILKQFPDDYKNRSPKDLTIFLSNIYGSISKNFKKKQSKPNVPEPPHTPSPNLKRPLIESVESEPKRLKVDIDSEPKTPTINSSNNDAVKDKPKTNKNIRDILNMSKAKTKVHKVIYPSTILSDVEGVGTDVVTSIKDWMISLDDKPPYVRGILISGPEGCGKSLLAMSIAGEKKYPIISTSALSLFRGFSDEKTENIKNLFAQAENIKPCFVLLEGIDALMSQNRSSSSNDQNNQLVIKEIIQEIEDDSKVFVIATARKLENVDSDLRQMDIFEQTFNLKLPDLDTRLNLLKKFTFEHQCSTPIKVPDSQVNGEIEENGEVAENQEVTDVKEEIKITFDVDFGDVAEKTPGFSGRNLKMLLKHAKVRALGRYNRSTNADNRCMTEVVVQLSDFMEVLKKIKSTVMNKDFASIPKTTWQDIGALENVRQELIWEIMDQIKNPESSGEDGLLGSDGVMLFGPPGCGKTMIAKAMANEASINFLYIKGPELIDKYVGESEKNIRSLFQRAKECSPCLIFFDEIDSISEKRSSDVQGGTKVVQQLLIELDGAESRGGVYVMGATNRIDCVDAAFLRGNRFGTKLYVGLPTATGRLEILKCLTEKLTKVDRIALADDVDLKLIAECRDCENFNGADLKCLVRKASIEAKKESNTNGQVQVSQRHFDRVLGRLKPSVTPADLKKYEQMAKDFGTN